MLKKLQEKFLKQFLKDSINLAGNINKHLKKLNEITDENKK